MRIAIPLAEGRLSAHFGHCEEFALIDVAAGEIVSTNTIESPEHQPGLLPGWLASQGATAIIAAGMGGRAQALFTEQNIEVVTGAASEAPEVLVAQYITGTLVPGENLCDH